MWGGGTAWGLAGHLSVGSEQLHCASLIFNILLSSSSSSLFSFSVLLNCHYLNYKFYVFADSLLYPTVSGVSEWLCGAELPAGLNHNTGLSFLFDLSQKLQFIIISKLFLFPVTSTAKYFM